MKLHFCIPLSQRRPDALGGSYVLYSVYLDGFLFSRVRYSQLRRWNEQLRRVFGDSLPPFPPKYYLAMTASMADARRTQLEQYLQNLPVDPDVLSSDVFVDFLKQLQLVASHRIGLCRELLGYFGLFLVQFHTEGELSVVKKMAAFELPFVSLQNFQAGHCKVGLRKWYMDPTLDALLMDCRVAADLIYLQAVQDIEKEWAKPTQAQREKLMSLQKEDKRTQFLELSQEVRHYGCFQLDPCTCDYPEPGCLATVAVGNNAISCHITLPDDQAQDIIFQMNRVKCWQVTFLGTLLDMEGPQRTLNQNLELRFQYSEDNRWQWFVIYTKQAFLLSSCLKKMISEKMARLAVENPEMEIEVPEQGKSQRYHLQVSQWPSSSNFLPRKGKISIKVAEEDCVLGTIKEEDL
ncbi:sorting nexin-31 [Tenrec ecaudatus]|uniref:sorting nexin-31 n=1 Tax=Tenrec ecaudatus TaxID=94439 RepID=UPI003F597CDB